MKKIIIGMILISAMSFGYTMKEVNELHTLNSKISVITAGLIDESDGDSLKVLNSWHEVYYKVINKTITGTDKETVDLFVDIGLETGREIVKKLEPLYRKAE